MALASAGTLSGSVERTLSGVEGHSRHLLSSCIEPTASPEPVFDCLRLFLTKGKHGVCGGVGQIGVGLQQRSVAGLKAYKEDPPLHDC